VAHFFRRAYGLLREGGTFGLIATKTIREGDTRTTGLRWIRKNGGIIYAAKRRYKWPGEAAVVVSVVHIAKAQYFSTPLLDGRSVERITAYLVDSGGDDDPAHLVANSRKSFVGSYVLGMGFTFDDTDTKGVASPISRMRELITEDPRNAQRIFPYIGGDEVNSDPAHAYHRYVINFEDFPMRRDELGQSWGSASKQQRRIWARSGTVPSDYPDSVADDWPQLLQIVKDRVKPEREKLGNKSDGRRRKKFWWQWGRYTPGLYAATRGLDRVLVISQVTAHFCFTFLPSNMVFSHRLIVFPDESFGLFAVLQSRVHELWTRFFSYSLEDRLAYSGADAFDPFPLPQQLRSDVGLTIAGKDYYDFRTNLMKQAGEGLTKIYNRFNNPNDSAFDILRLRELHVEMDRAVLRAYGWDDIDARPVFEREWVDDDDYGPWRYRWPEPVRDEVLKRLLALNTERAADEARRGLTIEKPPSEEDEADDSKDFELEAEEA
jgi:hypothetical protein